MRKEEALKIYNAAQRLVDSIDAGKELIPADAVGLFALFMEDGTYGYKISKEDYDILEPYISADAVHKYTIGGVEVNSEYKLPTQTTICSDGYVYINIPKNSEAYIATDIGRMITETVCNPVYKRIKRDTLYEPKGGQDD